MKLYMDIVKNIQRQLHLEGNYTDVSQNVDNCRTCATLYTEKKQNVFITVDDGERRNFAMNHLCIYLIDCIHSH